jgi:hypothetical protein
VPTASPRVKVHPDLGAAALRAGRDRELRVWTLARALDAPGSGCVRVGDLADVAAAHGLRGLSRGALSRQIRDGEGIFWRSWRRGRDVWLSLRSLANVCEALGVDRLRYAPVFVEAPRQLRTWRGACCYSMFAGEHFSCPVSRATLATLTGATGRTQRRWRRAVTGVESRANASPTGQTWQRGEPVPDGHYPDYVDGALALLRHLPSSYRARFAAAPRGMARRVNQALRNAVQSERTATQERLFYTDPRAAARRCQRRCEGDAFFSLSELTARGGAALWVRLQFVNGALYAG